MAGVRREGGGEGSMQSGEGRRGAKNTWGREAGWCDSTGTLGGQQAGVTIMAATQNARPSWWHNRGYGFFAANLFGRSAMRQGPQKIGRAHA